MRESLAENGPNVKDFSSMARINIEDQFWIDISPIARKLGEDVAIGQAMRLFRIAQERIKRDQIVSDEDWRIHEFSEHLIPIFAVKIDGGYSVKGADKHFGWLKIRVESARLGGINSGKSRRSDSNTIDEAKRQNPEASSSSSSSNKKINNKKSQTPRTPAEIAADWPTGKPPQKLVSLVQQAMTQDSFSRGEDGK